MCGRFLLTTPAEDLVELLGLSEAPDVSPRFNIAPTQSVGLVRARRPGSGREWADARWGLIPAGARDPRDTPLLFNARAETLARKPAFRDAFRERRCLVPASGFYEWKAEGKKKIPYLIQMSDGRPFAFAGLWERWERGDPPVESCTIVTTEPNDVVRALHDRMPVILSPADYGRWLDPASPPVELLSLLTPFAGQLTAAPTGPLPAL